MLSIIQAGIEIKQALEVNCSQNLVRAYKMFRSRAQMALDDDNVGPYQYLMHL